MLALDLLCPPSHLRRVKQGVGQQGVNDIRVLSG